MKKTFAAILAMALVSGCAGRSPNMPTVAYETDNIQACEALEREVHTNASTAKAKIAANQSRDNGDAGIAVASVLFLPLGLLFMDTKNADGHEANALLDRNERLKQIAITKGCNVSGYPSVSRYE